MSGAPLVEERTLSVAGVLFGAPPANLCRLLRRSRKVIGGVRLLVKPSIGSHVREFLGLLWRSGLLTWRTKKGARPERCDEAGRGWLRSPHPGIHGEAP